MALHARQTRRRGGFTLLEVVIYLAVVILLLAVLIPMLEIARTRSRIHTCENNLTELGKAWQALIDEHGEFPSVGVQPDWLYGGVRFTALKGEPFFDMALPLNHYLGTYEGSGRTDIYRCPGDCGITGEHDHIGTGRRTAFRSFGTSYRANGMLLDARRSRLSAEPRGLRREEVRAPRSRLVLMGDAIWHERYESTGRDANWHDSDTAGNLLFLDLSVKFQEIQPRDVGQQLVTDPRFIGNVRKPSDTYGPIPD